MELISTRDVFGSDFTLAILRVKWGAFGFTGKTWTSDPKLVKLGVPLDFGFVCEDQDRGLDASSPESWKWKVKRETAIPVGRYRVKRTLSPKYQREMILLLDVPVFQGIRAHTGNDDDDTEGCQLAGLLRDTARGIVLKSSEANAWLDRVVKDCEKRAEEVWWTIQRDPATWQEAIESLPHLAHLRG